MLVERPTLHPLAESAIAELTAAGVAVAPVDVLWINEAALAVGRATRRSVESCVEFPVAVGGVLLYPLTFGAKAWWQIVPPATADDIRVIAFTLAHARTPEVLTKLVTRRQIESAVGEWVKGLTCGRAALSEAVSRVLGSHELVEIQDAIPRKANAARERLTGPGLIGMVLKSFPGVPLRYWLWEVSPTYLAEILAHVGAMAGQSEQADGAEITANAEFCSVVAHVKAQR